MNNFFAVPTDIWDDNAVTLTAYGVCIITAAILILIAISLIFHKKNQNTNAKSTTRQLVFSAMAVALSMVTSLIKLFELPMGGSVTLLSMLFIVLIAHWYGPAAGITTGMAYGLLQFVLEPVFYTIPQMLTDYPLAFGALGLSGFIRKGKYSLQTGYILGVFGRFIFAFLSGILFFAAYAPQDMHPALYSFLYNGSYLLAEAVLTLILISLPPISKALRQVKQLPLRD